MSNLGYVKVAALCPETTVANPQKNSENAVKSIKQAFSEGCQVICLPELFVSSYSCGDLFRNETLIKKSEDALLSLLNGTADSNAIIIIGLPVKAKYSIYNCAAVIQRGKILGIVPKMYLGEQRRHFAAGLNCNLKEIELCGETVPFGNLLFDVGNNFTFGVEIGNDLNAPVSPSSSMVLCGADIIFNPAADRRILTSEEYKSSLVKQLSSKCLCGYVTASAGMNESTTDFVFSGDCLIAENGELLAHTDSLYQTESFACACIDVQKLNALRNIENFADYVGEDNFTHIKVELPALSEDKIDRHYSSHPFIPDDKKYYSEQALAIQCAGLVKRMNHTRIKKLVIGISGGLDSTLALLVAHKTIKMLGLPEENVICITMPGFGTTDTTYNNAVNLIKALGAEFREIDIKAASIQHMNDIGHDINIHDITYENTQARERTQILMDIANKEGALLVGTGDLSEAALGWCTYNGDHMSMYNVNCGVPKTFIRCIVEHVADISNPTVSDLLFGILATPVSPELLPPDEQGQIAQKTEDKLGPYEVHDFLLYHFIRFGFSPEKLLFIAKKAFNGEYTEDQLKNWLKTFLRRFFMNQFKRSCVPDGPKVGTVGLSPRGDWQMPSDADCAAWLE